MRNIFLEKSYAKCREKLVTDPLFWKIKIEHISGMIQFYTVGQDTEWSSFIQFVFIES